MESTVFIVVIVVLHLKAIRTGKGCKIGDSLWEITSKKCNHYCASWLAADGDVKDGLLGDVDQLGRYEVGAAHQRDGCHCQGGTAKMAESFHGRCNGKLDQLVKNPPVYIVEKAASPRKKSVLGKGEISTSCCKGVVSVAVSKQCSSGEVRIHWTIKRGS